MWRRFNDTNVILFHIKPLESENNNTDEIWNKTNADSKASWRKPHASVTLISIK